MLSKENKKGFKKLLDELIKLSGFAEIASDIAINLGVDKLDKWVFDKFIDEGYEDEVNAFFTHVNAKEFSEAAVWAGEIADGVIDLPWFGEESEQRIVKGFFMMIEGVLIELEIRYKK